MQGDATRLLMIAVVLTIAGCGNGASPAPISASDNQEKQTGDPAAELVRNFRMGSNLEQMAIAVAATTHTSALISNANVVTEIRRLAPKYQAQWDANLAKAYSAHLSQEELRSIATEGRSSSFYPRLESQRQAIATDMKELSSPILQQLVTEALTNSVSEP